MKKLILLLAFCLIAININGESVDEASVQFLFPTTSLTTSASGSIVILFKQVFTVTYEITYNTLTLEEIKEKQEAFENTACKVRIKEIKPE